MLSAALISTTLLSVAPAFFPATDAPATVEAAEAPVEVAIAVTELEQLSGALAEGKWEKGNRLTTSILLKSVNQYGRGYLITKDIRKLPCKTLRSVDHLWTSSSNGEFGLSAQANIWLKMNGKTFDDVTQFEDRIGWLGAVDFISTVTAPDGHLPLRPVKPAGMADAWGGGWIQSMSKRLVACNIIEDPNAKPVVAPAAAPAATPKPSSPIKTPAPKPAPASTPIPDIRLRDIMNR